MISSFFSFIANKILCIEHISKISILAFISYFMLFIIVIILPFTVGENVRVFGTRYYAPDVLYFIAVTPSLLYLSAKRLWKTIAISLVLILVGWHLAGLEQSYLRGFMPYDMDSDVKTYVSSFIAYLAFFAIGMRFWFRPFVIRSPGKTALEVKQYADTELLVQEQKAMERKVKKQEKKLESTTENLQKLSLTKIKHESLGDVSTVLALYIEQLEQVSEDDEDSFAMLCSSIKSTLERNGKEIPSFLDSVSVGPDIHRINQTKKIFSKISKQITDLKNDSEMDEDERNVMIMQWEQYRDKEMENILST